MATEKFSNLALTTLDGSIDSSQTSIDVISNSLFPSTEQYRITIESEIMLVTGGAGTNTWTVERGIESTTAASHPDGTSVAQTLTVQGLLNFVRQNIEYRPATPGTYDEEFEGAIDTLPTDWAYTIGPPSGSDATFVNSRWSSMLTIEGTGNTSYELTRSNFTAAATFGIWGKIHSGPQVGFADKSFRFYVLNSGSTEARAFDLHAGANEQPQVRGLKMISSSESIGFSGGASNLYAACTHLYFGLTRASDVWTMWYSTNGISWQRYGSTESHTFTVAKFRINCGTTTSQSFVGIDWVRYRTDTQFPRA